MIFCCMWMLYAILFFGMSLFVIRAPGKLSRTSQVTNSAVEIVRELKDPTEFVTEES